MDSPIQKAVKILKTGGVVAFPTETVYGLGASISNSKAIQKIYQIKGRPFDNPLIVHIGSPALLYKIADVIPDAALKLIEKFWPGPLTIVLKKSALVSDAITAGLPSVAIRMPSHPLALKLLKTFGEPIAAPSANRSGRPSPTTYQEVVQELGNKVDMILDGGKSEFGLESTVIDLSTSAPRLLRPGFITYEEVRKFLPHLKLRKENGSGPLPSPGLRQAHYQPNCVVKLVSTAQWKDALNKFLKKNLRLGLISFSQTIPENRKIVFLKDFSNNKALFAAGLYSSLIEAEKCKVDLLLVESVEKKGIGRAIMDRLERASSNGNEY